ncbi:MAG: hypothetical protein AMXMBFR84_08330 [Candidatus Hydrogenedentota bacterium]
MERNHQRFLVQVLPSLAAKHGIALTELPQSNGWVFRLSKDGRQGYLFGYDFGLNNATSMLVADDKCATWDALTLAGVPCVEHVLFLNPAIRQKYVDDAGNWDSMREYLRRHDEGVVCKPNNGTGGIDVELACTMVALETIVQRLFAVYPSVCLSPFASIDDEYRCVVLDGTVETCFRKIRPEITGDGKRTLRELIADLPDELIRRMPWRPEVLSSQHTVVPEGMRFPLEWRHNLAFGAYPEIVSEASVETLAVRAAEAIDLRFGSVDVIRSRQGLSVLEINSGVMMERFARTSPGHHAIAVEIYSRVLSLFPFE